MKKNRNKSVAWYINSLICFLASAIWAFISYKENIILYLIVAVLFFIQGIIDIIVGVKKKKQ